jgi:hypothetical protein
MIFKINLISLSGLKILEPLENQYGLIGSNVTINCQTRGGTEAFWVLNRTAITVSHQSTKQDYEDIGVVFSEVESEGYYNLTMIVPAILPMNNTSIGCTAKNSMMNSAVENSNVVEFIVFDNFRKLIIRAVLYDIECIALFVGFFLHKYPHDQLSQSRPPLIITSISARKNS